MPVVGLPRRGVLLAGTLLLTVALGGCTTEESAGRARAQEPCSLLSQAQLAGLGRTHLRTGFAVDSQQEGTGNQGSKVCTYRIEVMSDPQDDRGEDGGVELHAYTEKSHEALTFFRSLSSDEEEITGLGDFAWWSVRNQRLLILKGDILLMVHFQVPSDFRERDTSFAIAVGQQVASQI
jgi:hypothetical protein